MADASGSSGVPDFIAEGQSQKEVTANGYFDASSPSILFGRRASTTGLLTWGFYGGEMLVDGVLTAINNSSLGLIAAPLILSRQPGQGRCQATPPDSPQAESRSMRL